MDEEIKDVPLEAVPPIDGELLNDEESLPEDPALRQKIEEDRRNLTLERDSEVIPAARELLARLAVRSDLAMGSNQTISVDEAAQFYRKVYIEDVVPMLRTRNMRLDDVSFLFSVMLQPIQLLRDVTEASFKMNEEIASAKIWGLKEYNELRVADLEKVLMEDTRTASGEATLESPAPVAESIPEASPVENAVSDEENVK